MNHFDERWTRLIAASWVVHIILALAFWGGLVWICVSLYRTYGFRSLRWIGAYCGISALASIATFVGRMVRLPAALMPFSPLMAARVIAPTVLHHAAHSLVALMILSEIAILLQQKHPGTESKLVTLLAGVNQRLEMCGLILVSVAAISFGLSIVWLGGR
jgi:hypothetical protein